MRTRISLLLALALGIMGGDREPLAGQVPESLGPVKANIQSPAAVPFGPGERLEYDVRAGILASGEGYMSVNELETVRGRTTYHVTMAYGGGNWLAKVQDQFDSWIDVIDLTTLSSIEDTNQLGKRRYKHFEFYPERMIWERPENGKTGELASAEPLDQISFFYFARTLPLEVGDEYELNRYYKESGNPVILRVLRKDTVNVPAGTFPTIVVQPIIQSSGLFGEGGKAELYFSDDERRLLVQMKSHIFLIGSLTLSLRSIVEGHPLRPTGGEPGRGDSSGDALRGPRGGQSR
jgi:hypothetical protein